jgi:hypothetical protein
VNFLNFDRSFKPPDASLPDPDASLPDPDASLPDSFDCTVASIPIAFDTLRWYVFPCLHVPLIWGCSYI